MGGQSHQVPQSHTSGLFLQGTLGSKEGMSASHRIPVIRQLPGPQSTRRAQSTVSSRGVLSPHPTRDRELMTRQASSSPNWMFLSLKKFFPLKKCSVCLVLLSVCFVRFLRYYQ